MFDLEIIIPISSKGKYIQRFKDLKKYGLINLGNKKVVLKLLLGPTETVNRFDEQLGGINDFRENGLIVQIFKSKYNSAVQKIYDYYLQMTKKDISESRWFAKFDDDSITDLSLFIDNLDLDFDHEKEFYVVTELCKEIHTFEINLLKKLNYKWFLPGHKPLIHEWEGCCLSRPALKKIIENKNSLDFFGERVLSDTPPGDVALAVAARMNKIYPVEANFMSKNPCLHHFSVFGGIVTHIHYMARDINASLFDFYIRFMENKSRIKKELINKKFSFYRTVTNDKNHIEKHIINLYFKDNGLFEFPNGGGNENETYWEFLDGQLIFYNSNFVPTTIFHETDLQFNCFHGNYLFEKKIKHHLKII